MPTGLTKAVLGRANEVLNSNAQDLIVTALLHAFSSFGADCFERENELSLLLESHGRDQTDLDLSRTVGWLTQIYPARFQCHPTDIIKTAIEVKETFRQLVNKKHEFGNLFYGSQPDGTVDIKLPQVMFNYLGQLDAGHAEQSIVTIAPESKGDDIAPDLTRPTLLEVTAMVVQQQLHLSVRYHPDCHNCDLIKSLLQVFEGELDKLVNQCTSNMSRKITPSDVPETGMQMDEIDDFLNEICE